MKEMYAFLWTSIIFSSIQASNNVDQTNSNQQKLRYCHSQTGIHTTVREFQLSAYAWCFSFIFYIKYRPFVNTNGSSTSVVFIHNGRIRVIQSVDYKNLSAKSDVCSTLTSDECHQWVSCCAAADNCCQRQLALPPEVNNTCGRIWDGWSCWNNASPGTKNYVTCPLFMPYFSHSRSAVKTCTSKGEWVKRTDYSHCVDKQGIETSLFLGLGCSIASVLFLVPAVCIFIRYRALSRQNRVRVHMNFFMALIIQEVVSGLWDILITYDKVKSSKVFQTALMANGFWCKLLSFLKIYFKGCSFTWMLCEGIFLQRLMYNAFSPPQSLTMIYVIGWGVPLIFSGVYALLRKIYNDESCWAYSYKNLEWIFDAPNLMCLVANLLILGNILRILLTQMQSHPNEPGNFRRAVKATFVLIPLFGIQLFVTLYRVPISKEGGIEYERFTIVVDHSQGVFVAILFCYINGEVISNLKKSWRRRLNDRYFRITRRMTISTNQTMSSQAECDVAENCVVSDNCVNISDDNQMNNRELELKESNGIIPGMKRKVSFANFPTYPT
ncbi:calcitonin gene-related peptide type 1 receptor-like [Saccostrea echinata]|uniref:calcitonin gene-related peptide type 1 receptor-like n=1 Tax=Saccostrea echinata TaxID=191078 RepID=UPI002A7FC776|nr:calcitonin gene-related peptide type 1 receptor-like [Saccostrea echinata]